MESLSETNLAESRRAASNMTRGISAAPIHREVIRHANAAPKRGNLLD
ncbi:MAG: hypothetical protein JWO82_1430, partial [Akkermansiaceae bacterium]|nr:hypothetical protein [Akkermansiaceae bacterium]